MQLDSSATQAATGLVPFLKGWGSLIIASVALVLPGAIALWKKFFRSGSVDIYETRLLDVSYGNWGPAIGLRGTLRAVHRDQFVRAIDLTVTKHKDGSTHHFDWILFRAEKITGLGAEDTSAEIASGFMLLTTQPHRYSILFSDTGHSAEMKPHIDALVEEWTTYRYSPGAIAALLQQKDIYAPFSTHGTHVNTWTALDRLMYWEPGKYSLEMRVHTTRPERTFTRDWVFELTKAESDRLRLNSVVLCHLACDQSSTYHFVNPSYQEPIPPSTVRRLKP